MAQKDAWHVPSTSNYTLLDYNSTYACYNDDATKGAPSYFATGYGIGYGCGGNRYTGGNVGCVKIFYQYKRLKDLRRLIDYDSLRLKEQLGA